MPQTCLFGALEKMLPYGSAHFCIYNHYIYLYLYPYILSPSLYVSFFISSTLAAISSTISGFGVHMCDGVAN